MYTYARLSLSYICTRSLKPWRPRLRLTQHDAILVHKSLKVVVERGLQVKLPQDEFQCYRDSKLWLQMPANYVREWFFARHPSAVIGSIWSNISTVNKELGREGMPFTLDF
ncbi:unnamed protein product [Symbiodinium sp. KB8]|nr:unnamed protein product [Symbiodinium sp. KB8]